MIISSPAASYETAEETGPVSVSHVRPCDSQNKRAERMRGTCQEMSERNMSFKYII